MKNVMDNDETLTIEPIEEDNAECQVRRKIEEILEQRRAKDELGDFEECLE